MGANNEVEYAPIRSDENGDFQPGRKSKTSTFVILKTVLIVEALNVLVIGLLYGLLHRAGSIKSSNFFGMPLAYNVSTTFNSNRSDITHVGHTDFADAYWQNITFHSRNGLVSLPKTSVLSQGLELSGLPTYPDQTVLQVDLFHQLHCLERIRHDINNMAWLVEVDPIRDDNEPYTVHTLHCVDYLRQSLMCQADLTLVSTEKTLEFDRTPPRMCRDFEAVRQWVFDHKWEYEKFQGVQPAM